MVQQGHRGAVALIPVVGVACLRFFTGVALLGLVDGPTQINFYGFTIFAAGRDGKWNKCEELGKKDAPAEPPIFLAHLHVEPESAVPFVGVPGEHLAL